MIRFDRASSTLVPVDDRMLLVQHSRKVFPVVIGWFCDSLTTQPRNRRTSGGTPNPSRTSRTLY
jgi:hypothetical protein